MAYLGSKVLLVAAISAAVQSQTFAQTMHLELPSTRSSLGSGINLLTGANLNGADISHASSLVIDATLGDMSLNNSGLNIAELSGADASLTLNSLIAGKTAVAVAGGGLITLNSGADVQSMDVAISAHAGSGKHFDLMMAGGRIVGDVQGVRNFEVTGAATLTSAVLDVERLEVKSGSLALQRQGMEVTGDFGLAKGASLDLQINQTTDARYALMYVGGEAVLEKDSTINLHTPSSQFVTQDTQYTLIKADELIDRGVDIRSSLSPFLQLKNVHVFDDNSLMATIGLVGSGGNDGNGGSDEDDAGNTEQDLNDFAQRLEQQGASRNGIHAAQSFVSVLAELGNEHALYQSFLDARDGDLNALLDQLTPETSGAVVNAAMSASGLTGAALGARAASVGANSGEMLKETGAWVQVLNGDASQSRRNGVAGYDADSKGLVLGADGKVNEALTLGVALSLVNTDVSGAAGSDTEVDTQLLSAYGRYESGAWGLTGSVSYGQSQNDSKRAIAHEVAKASYDSNLLAAELELGYRTDIGSLAVEPVTALRYSNVAVDRFKEKGSSAALANNSQRFEVLDLGVGFNLSAEFGEFIPSARLMAYHDFAQDTVKSTSSFILGGNSFVTNGADATKWTYEAGLGLDWSRGQYSVGVGYDYIRKADFNADTVSLKARYDF